MGERTAGEMARQTDISVVEPNEEHASIDEFLAEGVVPRDELGPQTGDEQNRGVDWLSERVVGDVDITHRRVLDLRGRKHSGRLRRRAVGGLGYHHDGGAAIRLLNPLRAPAIAP